MWIVVYVTATSSESRHRSYRRRLRSVLQSAHHGLTTQGEPVRNPLENEETAFRFVLGTIAYFALIVAAS